MKWKAEIEMRWNSGFSLNRVFTAEGQVSGTVRSVEKSKNNFLGRIATIINKVYKL